MSKFKELKQKVKDNKGKILTGIVFISGISYLIVKQNNTIKSLKLNDIKQQNDINILKSVMSGTVLSNLKESTKRQLRYAEGRLRNGLKDGTISKIDEQIRRDEIVFFSAQIENINKAEDIISK